MKNWLIKIGKNTHILKLIQWLSSGYLKNSKVTYWKLLNIIYERTKTHDLIGHSRSMAFSFTMAIFPAIIFLFSIIPYFSDFFGIEHLDSEIMIFLQETMPKSTYEAASETILGIVKRRQVGLVSFGFIFAVYLATSGIMTLMSTFDNVYKRGKKKRSYFKANLVALLITGILAVTFLFSIVFIVFSQNFIDWLLKEVVQVTQDYIVTLILFVRVLVMLLIFFLSISVIYVLAPSVDKRWPLINSGSIWASILSLLTTIGFTYYINNFGTYNKFYGSIGAMIAIMVWIWLLSLIIIGGYELNASIDVARRIYDEGEEMETL